MNHKVIVFFSIVVSLSLILGGCAAPGESGEKIQIGLQAPLTGDYAAEGQWAEQSVAIAAELINSKGGVLGKPVEIVVADDASNPKDSALAIECRETGEVVGLEEHGGIHTGRTSTWLGTFIVKEHRRRGFGVEAKQLMLCYLFENYPLATVFADTTATHQDARRSLELCGMHFVGARRKAHCFKGRYVDVVLYQILRREWEAAEYRTRVRRG